MQVFIPFWVYFCTGIREHPDFILLHVAVQFFQHHLLKRLSFLHCIFFPPLSIKAWFISEKLTFVFHLWDHWFIASKSMSSYVLFSIYYCLWECKFTPCSFILFGSRRLPMSHSRVCFLQTSLSYVLLTVLGEFPANRPTLSDLCTWRLLVRVLSSLSQRVRQEELGSRGWTAMLWWDTSLTIMRELWREKDLSELSHISLSLYTPLTCRMLSGCSEWGPFSGGGGNASVQSENHHLHRWLQPHINRWLQPHINAGQFAS